MKPAYLFDASSIIRALKETRLLPLRNQAIQWLTIYEVLNALWKEVNLLHILEPGEASFLASTFAELLQTMKILSPQGLEVEILSISISTRLTVYDASYIALAKKHELTLVTEDKKLRDIASRFVNTISLDDIQLESH
ncbi:type II toxin-antitoxin system VapC family toxin [Pyrofollis japonicus]|uniref:type II toxin-antitoxin system VapC family toxin n=1 Tax=Pyrofollis japonicus TaxID=3060460 RepID=UPI00295A8302|nr:type II toxin-antitoxin system VapC family toxin [Pyrofollis japonicus]